MAEEKKGFSHDTIERNTLLLIVLILITVSIGGLVQIVSGLKDGDMVVEKAGAFVRNGDTITPVRDQQPVSN